MEHKLLAELGFCVHVQHPHKIIIMYLDMVHKNQNKNLIQTAWNYMNDSFRTTLFCIYQPETIACACIFLAARMLKLHLPTEPIHWYELFDAKTEDVETIARTILELYSKVPRPYTELISHVELLRSAKKKQLKDANQLHDDSPFQSGNNSPANVDSPAPITEASKKSDQSPRGTKTSSRSRSRSKSHRHDKDRHRHRDSRHRDKHRGSKHSSKKKSRSRSNSRDRSRSSSRERHRRDRHRKK